jgi:hypothetical protein
LDPTTGTMPLFLGLDERADRQEPAERADRQEPA